MIKNDLLKIFPFGAEAYGDGSGKTELVASILGDEIAIFNSEAEAKLISKLINDTIAKESK